MALEFVIQGLERLGLSLQGICRFYSTNSLRPSNHFAAFRSPARIFGRRSICNVLIF
jgi:hypothetical protein